ncbi:MAG: hypothetical protein ABIJ57_15760 [Pseudomonadota bacterium]
MPLLNESEEERIAWQLHGEIKKTHKQKTVIDKQTEVIRDCGREIKMLRALLKKHGVEIPGEKLDGLHFSAVKT